MWKVSNYFQLQSAAANVMVAPGHKSTYGQKAAACGARGCGGQECWLQRFDGTI